MGVDLKHGFGVRVQVLNFLLGDLLVDDIRALIYRRGENSYFAFLEVNLDIVSLLIHNELLVSRNQYYRND